MTPVDRGTHTVAVTVKDRYGTDAVHRDLVVPRSCSPSLNSPARQPRRTPTPPAS